MPERTVNMWWHHLISSLTANGEWCKILTRTSGGQSSDCGLPALSTSGLGKRRRFSDRPRSEFFNIRSTYVSEAVFLHRLWDVVLPRSKWEQKPWSCWNFHQGWGWLQPEEMELKLHFVHGPYAQHTLGYRNNLTISSRTSSTAPCCLKMKGVTIEKRTHLFGFYVHLLHKIKKIPWKLKNNFVS